MHATLYSLIVGHGVKIWRVELSDGRKASDPTWTLQDAKDWAKNAGAVTLEII